MVDIFKSSDTNKKTNTEKKSVDDYSEVLRAEKPTTNALKAFAPKPVKVAFDSQLDEEEIVMLLRRHPITQWKNVLLSIILFLMPFLLFSVPLFDFFTIRYKAAIFLGFYLLLIGFSLSNFLTWYFSVYIITDERIIDVDFTSLLTKNVSVAQIENIEDITVDTSGTLRSIFDYGTVQIQTAAATNELEFEDVPHPAKVSKLLNELIIQEKVEELEGRVR